MNVGLVIVLDEQPQWYIYIHTDNEWTSVSDHNLGNEIYMNQIT